MCDNLATTHSFIDKESVYQYFIRRGAINIDDCLYIFDYNRWRHQITTAGSRCGKEKKSRLEISAGTLFEIAFPSALNALVAQKLKVIVKHASTVRVADPLSRTHNTTTITAVSVDHKIKPP